MVAASRGPTIKSSKSAHTNISINLRVTWEHVFGLGCRYSQTGVQVVRHDYMNYLRGSSHIKTYTVGMVIIINQDSHFCEDAAKSGLRWYDNVIDK